MKFCLEILETLSYHVVKTRSLYLNWSWNGTGSWQTDRQTDERTDEITVANTRYSYVLVYLLSCVKKRPQLIRHMMRIN